MEQMQQINGMSENHTAHHMPVASIPELEYRQPKQESLIDKCLKGLIKERMSGSLINKERKGGKMESRRMSMIYTGNSIISEAREQSLNHYLNGNTKGSRYGSPSIRNQDRLLYHRSTTNTKRQLLIGERRRHNHNLSINLSKIKEQIPRIESDFKEKDTTQVASFISQIDDNPEDNNDKKPSNSMFHLPKIARKIKNEEKKKEQLAIPSNIVKNLFKPGPEELINMNVWTLLTDQEFLSADKKKKRKQSVNLSQLNPSTLGNKQSKESKGSMFRPKFPNSSREQIYVYIDSLPLSLKLLIKKFLFFFDVKLPNEVGALFYASLIEKAQKINKRGWAALGFKFWDKDKDGMITSNDIFQRFREFNGISQEEESENSSARKNPQQKTKRSKNEQNKEKRSDEEEEQHEDNYGLKKVPGLPQPRTNTQNTENTQTQYILPNDPAIENQNPLAQLKLMIQRLETILEAKRLMNVNLEKLNTKFKEQEKLNDETEIDREDDEVKYLEEVIVADSATKYADIEPLLSAGKKAPTSRREQSHKLELFPAELNIKCSSSYKQCFIATEHNQQTRLTRQKIETFKLNLIQMKLERRKKIREKIQEDLRFQKFLTYEEYVDSNLGEFVKRIILLLLGAKEKN